MVRRTAPILIRQFDICELPRRGSRQTALVVVLQHDELDSLATLIVAPLLNDLPSETHPRLHPKIAIGEHRAFLFVDRMAAVQRSELGLVVGSAAGEAWAICRAIDIAFFGF